MKKIILLLLSVLLCTCMVFTAACSQAFIGFNGVNPENSSSGEEGGETPSGTPTSTEQPFTVQLRTMDGGALPSLEGIYAIWTEAVNGAEVHRAYFNDEGLAVSYKPDGDYEVTLSAPPVGYTYDPNVHTATNLRRDRAIDLFPLRGLTGGDGSAYNAFQARTTGAYRFVFKKPSDIFYFVYNSSKSGAVTLESLLDTTANEVTPILEECFHITNADVKKTVKGGGAESTYTKNFKYEQELSDSQETLFKLRVETLNKKAFPITVDVLITRTGDYHEYVPPEITLMEAKMLTLPTDDFSALEYEAYEDLGGGAWRAAMPTTEETGKEYRFTAFGLQNDRQLDEEMVVEYNGYYYYNKNYKVLDEGGNKKPKEADLSRPVYVVLNRDINTLFETWEGVQNSDIYFQANEGLSWYPSHICYEAEHPSDPDKVGLDYNKFFDAYSGKANSDGAYLVTTELKKYLYDISVALQFFYDGMGLYDYRIEEGQPYGCRTSASARWLLLCGTYDKYTK